MTDTTKKPTSAIERLLAGKFTSDGPSEIVAVPLALVEQVVGELEQEIARQEKRISDLERMVTSANEQVAGLREGLESLLCDVAQIFDGWHADGTAWSEWDESVRRRVSTKMAALAALSEPPTEEVNDEVSKDRN